MGLGTFRTDLRLHLFKTRFFRPQRRPAWEANWGNTGGRGNILVGFFGLPMKKRLRKENLLVACNHEKRERTDIIGGTIEH